MTAKPARLDADVRTIQVPVQELTAEAFAPYGEVSSPRTGFRLDFSGDAMTLCEVLIEKRPLHLDFLARHVRSTQTYIPLRGHESIIVVAPPSDLADSKALPDLTQLAAFRVTGECAVNLHKGTWHRSPLPLGDNAHFIVIDREGTLEDLDLVDLRVNLGAAIEIDL